MMDRSAGPNRHSSVRLLVFMSDGCSDVPFRLLHDRPSKKEALHVKIESDGAPKISGPSPIGPLALGIYGQ